MKANARNIPEINTSAGLAQNNSKKGLDSPSPKSPAKVHHHSTARMQSVIDDNEKRQIDYEKDAKATIKAQMKAGGYPKSVIEP